MSSINNVTRTSHIARPLYIVCSHESRSFSFFSLFKSKTEYLHGTSVGALGEEQISKRQFLPRESVFASYLWATPDKELAIHYAMRSAEKTNTRPILVRVMTEQELEDVDWGNNKYPAFNTHKAPIYIVEIEDIIKERELRKEIELMDG